MAERMDFGKLALTRELLESVDFKKKIVGVAADGTPITEETKPGVKDWFIRDSKTPGFCARVTGGGIRFYAQRKLFGRPCRFDCGSMIEVSIEQARKTAKEALRMMAGGIDPNSAKKKARAEIEEERRQRGFTFGALLRQDRESRSNLDSAKTAADRKDVEGWLSPLPIWRMPVSAVRKDDLGAMLAEMRKKGDATALKCWRYASAAWNRMGPEDMPETNPFKEWLKENRLPVVKARQRALDAEAEDGKRWLRAVADLRNIAGSRAFPGRVMADYVLLTLCWGARRSEAAKLTTADVDFGRGFVRFTDTKNSSDHYFPLTPGCEAILRARIADNGAPRGRDFRMLAKGEALAESAWIFPSKQRGKHLSEPRSALAAGKDGSGLKIDMHDLRRTFAGDVATDVFSEGGSLDFSLVKLAMNHADAQADVTQNYIVLKPKLRMLRPLYERQERRVLTAAGLSHLLPAEGDPLEGKLAELRKRAADNPELLAKLDELLASG